MVADKTGSLAGTKRHDFLPFGEELYAGVGGRTSAQGYAAANTLRERWATYERDDETGLDFAQARYYSSTQGRFTSPDEFTGGAEELFDFTNAASQNPTFYADISNPQSLNKYQYTYNNPATLNDPSGHCVTPECLWDVANVAMGVASAVDNIKKGNYGSAIVDGIGVAIDSAAAIAPIAPGGAAAIIRVARGVDKAVDTAKAAKKAEKVKDVVVDAGKHPESAKHIIDAQKAGQPSTLTIDRGGAKNRRKESLKGTPRTKGKDRDEYPPAVTREGGRGASVRPISPRDNRGSGSSIGRQIRKLPNGSKIRIKVKPKARQNR